MRSGFLVLAAAVVVAACARTTIPGRYNEVEIIGTDYAFTAPEKLPAGFTTFRFRNNGKVRHELNISRLRKGVSIDTFLAAVRSDKTVKDLIDGPVGVLFADPGGMSDAGLTVQLSPGEHYAVICIFADSSGAERHYNLGMYKTISVGGAQGVAPMPQLATDTIRASDYAFQYPRTLKPARHTFVMQNIGKQRHEFDIALLKKGVTLARLQEVEKTGASVDSLFEGSFGLLHGRPDKQSVGALSVPLLPGRDYVIACFFKDDEKSPEHYALGMFGSIHVEDVPYDSTYERSQARIERALGRQ